MVSQTAELGRARAQCWVKPGRGNGTPLCVEETPRSPLVLHVLGEFAAIRIFTCQSLDGRTAAEGLINRCTWRRRNTTLHT